MKNRMSLNELIFSAILQSYRLGEVKSYRLLPGWFNTSFRVETKRGTYILRFFRPGAKTAKELEFLFELLSFLRSKGCPVQEVFPTKKGALSLEIEILDKVMYLAVLSYLEGEIKKYGAIKDCHLQRVGRYLAKLHGHLRNFPLAQIFRMRSATEEFEQRLRKIKTQLSANLDLNYFDLSESRHRFLVEAWRIDYSGFVRLQSGLMTERAQLIHADLTVSNFLFDGKDVSGILDFDDVRMGTVEEDISIAIGAWLLNAVKLSTREVVDVMWRAYTSEQSSLLQYDNQGELKLVLELVKLYIWEQIAWAVGPPVVSYLEKRHKESMLTFERRYRDIYQLLKDD